MSRSDSVNREGLPADRVGNQVPIEPRPFVKEVLTVFYLYLQAILSSPEMREIFLEIKTKFRDSE